MAVLHVTWTRWCDPCQILLPQNAHHCVQSQSQGIQTLLEAEKEAAKVVQEARQCTRSVAAYSVRTCCLTGLPNVDRVQRLKDARTEAQREIEAYAKSKEAEFAKIEERVRHGFPS